MGEQAIAWALSQSLDPARYRRIDDVIIPNGYGGTAQLDHVIISEFGIFVVETKNRNGLIAGASTETIWHQITDNRRYPFQNPLLQNENHIRALAALVGLPRWAFHSVVYFCGEARFVQPMPANVRTGDLITAVRSKTRIILYPDEMNAAWRLLCHCKRDPNLNACRHVQNVQSLHPEFSPRQNCSVGKTKACQT